MFRKYVRTIESNPDPYQGEKKDRKRGISLVDAAWQLHLDCSDDRLSKGHKMDEREAINEGGIGPFTLQCCDRIGHGGGGGDRKQG